MTQSKRLEELARKERNAIPGVTLMTGEVGELADAAMQQLQIIMGHSDAKGNDAADKVAKLIRQMYRLLSQQQEWVRVSERTPEDAGVPVLTCNDGGTFRVLSYAHREWRHSYITHWMPLPAAPQEDAKE